MTPLIPRSVTIGLASQRLRPRAAVACEDNPLAAPEWTLSAHHVTALVLAALTALMMSALIS